MRRVSVRESVAPEGSGLTGIVQRLRPDRNPKSAVVLALWLLGLFSVFLSPAPVKITPEMEAKFGDKMQLVEVIDSELHEAALKYREAQARVQDAQVWFWRFRPEHRKVVRARQVREASTRADVERLRAERVKRESAAKAELGLWSEEGLREGRHLFWSSYDRGKLFAQRRSLWDAFYSIMLSRESDALGRLLGLLLMVCINFTTGMLTSLIFFVFALPGMIAAFQPGVVSGVLYFALATLGGASVIVTFLGLLYGGSVTFVYAVAGPSVRRLEGRRRPGRLGHRSHMD